MQCCTHIICAISSGRKSWISEFSARGGSTGDFYGVGRTTLSEVEDNLVSVEDDLSGKGTDNSQLEGERNESEKVREVRAKENKKRREGRRKGGREVGRERKRHEYK